jgi:serine/threonine protein kinase
MRTVSGLVKLIHPDGDVSKDELAEYLTFAVEMRRRVKEQLRRINPSEFARIDLSFVDKTTGKEFAARCPETPQMASPEAGNSPIGPLATNTPAKDAEPPEIFHHYELQRTLESGGMAEAYMARNRDTGQRVFLKRVRRKSADEKSLEREMRIYEKLMRMNTTHVLQVLDFVRDDEYFALVTEFADGGDLQMHVEAKGNGRGLAVEETKQILLSVANAIQELHEHDIVHRDLKPANVLSSGGSWKISDFGISKNLSRAVTQKTFQGYGTLGYAAPEQFQGVEARPTADVYSLGKIMVFLLTGQTDIDHVQFWAWRDLISRCIRQDPQQRPVIGKVIAEIASMPA